MNSCLSSKSAFVLFFVFLVFGSSSLYAQKKTKEELEKEKIEIEAKIVEAEKILSETQSQKEVSVGELNALNNLIEINKRYSTNLNNEIKFIKKDISSIKSKVGVLNTGLDTLRREYAKMLYATQKTVNDQEQIIFLFSADNYNQITLRIKYLEMIREARKAQYQKIIRTKENLVKQELVLKNKNEEKEQAFEKIRSEKERLDSLNDEQWIVAELLAEKEKDIRQNIKDYQKEQEKINKLIEDIIREEIARKKRLEKERLLEEHRRSKINNKNFEANRGKLSWPIDKGFVSRKFGMQDHPSIPGIKVNNPGIGLQTQKGAAVKAVFQGTVVTVAEIPGAGKLVMISHGDYYTVYSKLKTVAVKKGDKVAFRQVVGTVKTSPQGVTELGFQIWKEMNKENPEQWLIKDNI